MEADRDQPESENEYLKTCSVASAVVKCNNMDTDTYRRERA